MVNIESITEFLGWCAVLNIGLLTCYTIVLVSSVGDWAKSIHAKLFRVSKEGLEPLYFNFLANYKIAVLILNVIPYIALKIMG